jgi:hypothetical protein
MPSPMVAYFSQPPETDFFSVNQCQHKVLKILEFRSMNFIYYLSLLCCSARTGLPSRAAAGLR